MRKRGCNLKKHLLYCIHITGKGARKMKRIISLMLSLIIILSLVCVAAPGVSAASEMKTSTLGINMIKSFEGFSKMPHYDNGQWTVGYGTGVSGADLENYNANGITEEQATKLLTEYLESFEKSVNSFIDTNNLKLSQQQFDALVSFTYNLGPSWMQGSGTFRSAVINGTTGNDFIYAMAQFGKAGGMAVGGLIERRLCEANLYLNGVYSTEPPVNFKYVIYTGNLDGVVPTVTIQGYDTTKTAAIKSTVSKSGYRFLGWYTKEEGGEWITSLGAKSASTNRLYAHWQQGEGALNSDGSIKGTAVEYTGYAPNGAQKTYKSPNGAEAGSVKAEQNLKVVAEYMDSKGVKWGKLSGGSWLVITGGLKSSPVFEDPSSAIDPITVTVTSGGVNNRIGPGTNYAKQGTYTKGEQLVLTAVQKGGNYNWGKSEKGWIALQYTDYETSKVQNSADAKKVTAIGTIIKTDVVNVRAGAGTNHAKVGTYKRNDEIKITLRQKVGKNTWGLTEKGWVSLYYVKVTEVAAGSVPDINISGGTTTGGTTTGGTTTGNSTTVVSSGMVYNCDALRIRSGAGTSNAHIGDYVRGTYVNIYETTTVRSEIWGRTDKGWISLRYVKLDAPTTGVGVTGRVVKCSTLNVRSGAGTHYPKVAKLTKGTKVEILEYTKVGKATWGRTAQGWISLYYVSLDAPVTNLDSIGGTGSTPSATEPSATEPSATEPAATKYTVTANAATNGSVGANVDSAAKGTQVTLTITPKSGYELDTLTVKDASNAVLSVTDNKFTMPASNVTITATFKAQAAKYNVTINSATNGKVTANTASCTAGTEVVLTAAPNAGYELDTLTVMNTTTNASVAVSGGKFTMPAGNVNVVATFKATTASTYKVTVNAISNGAVTANTTSAKAGDTITLTVAPNSGYELDELSVKNATSNASVAVSGSGNTRTFTMPASNVTIAATFKIVKYNVTISTSTNGSVSVNPSTYEKGATVSLSVAPDTGYELDTLTVKDASNGAVAVSDNKFTMPASNVTVTATFKKATYKVTFGTIKNGVITTTPANAKAGDTVSLVAKPSDGYELETLTVKDANGNTIAISGTGNNRTFVMPTSSVVVNATFKTTKYAVEITTPTNGALSVNPDTYAKGETVTLVVTPNAGYELDKITVKDSDDKDVTVKDNKFTMPASAVKVTATFKLSTLKLTVGETTKGKVTGAPTTAKMGDTITLTITPDTGYELHTLTVKDAKGTAVTVSGTGETRTFTMPATDVTIAATFRVPPVMYNVTVDSETVNGHIWVDKTSAEENETVVVRGLADEDYELDTLTVNGDPVTTETFKMPAKDVFITATFKAMRTITVTVCDADGVALSGVSVKLCDQSSGALVDAAAAKVSNSSGKVTFSGTELAGVTKGMRLVAQVTGNYDFAFNEAKNNDVRDATGVTGALKGADGNGNDYLDIIAETNEPIYSSFTIRVAPIS